MPSTLRPRQNMHLLNFHSAPMFGYLKGESCYWFHCSVSSIKHPLFIRSSAVNSVSTSPKYSDDQIQYTKSPCFPSNSLAVSSSSLACRSQQQASGKLHLLQRVILKATPRYAAVQCLYKHSTQLVAVY